MAQSLFITLRQHYPEAEIDVIAPAWSLPILERMSEVRRGISLPVDHGEFALRTRWQIGRELKSTSYDWAITLPRSLKSALVPWFARIGKRTGYRGEMRYGVLNDIRLLNKNRLTQTVQRYVALGLEPFAESPPETPYPHLQVDGNRQILLQKRFDLTMDKPVVAILPGAEYGPAKQWPANHYARLINNLMLSGRECWILGSKRDDRLAREISAECQTEPVNLCGQTELVEVIVLLALCSAAVSNDSGLMHIAAAVGIPLVAIYGSSTPAYTPPLTSKAKVVYLELECSPCFKRSCPLGDTPCLGSIMPEEVLDYLLAL